MSTHAAKSTPQRVVLIGDTCVGKTSLLNRFMDNHYSDHELTTVGGQYRLYSDVYDNIEKEIEIWDTAGQEKFRALGPLYYRHAKGAIAVFDITSAQSLKNLEAWIRMFTEVAGSNCAIAVVANKADLAIDVVQQSKDGQLFAEDQGYLFRVTSAATGEGVRDLFTNFFERVVKVVSEGKLEGIPRATQVDSQPESKATCPC
jgi:small GTP-binding protein